MFSPYLLFGPFWGLYDSITINYSKYNSLYEQYLSWNNLLQLGMETVNVEHTVHRVLLLLLL